MKKKRKERLTEMHGKPRRMNPTAARRIGIVLGADVLLKVKTRAFEASQSMQQYLSELITKTVTKE